MADTCSGSPPKPRLADYPSSKDGLEYLRNNILELNRKYTSMRDDAESGINLTDHLIRCIDVMLKDKEN